MTDPYQRASTRPSRVIRARPEVVYAPFIDPAALVAAGSRLSLEQLARRFE